eukprot:scaffold172412_cov42-Prasinocladus_malaysianus.AAC.2
MDGVIFCTLTLEWVITFRQATMLKDSAQAFLGGHVHRGLPLFIDSNRTGSSLEKDQRRACVTANSRIMQRGEVCTITGLEVCPGLDKGLDDLRLAKGCSVKERRALRDMSDLAQTTK